MTRASGGFSFLRQTTSVNIGDSSRGSKKRRISATFAGGVESTSGSTLGDSDFFWGDVGSIVVVSGSGVVDSGSLLAGQPDAAMMQKVATIAVCQIISAQLL